MLENEVNTLLNEVNIPLNEINTPIKEKSRKFPRQTLERVKIELPGDPIPMQRPRYSLGNIYDPQSKIKRNLFPVVREAFPKKYMSIYKEVPVTVQMIFYMPFPKAATKTFIEQNFHKPHIKRPDIDNLIKFYLDLMNGLIYTDDSLVSNIYAQKVYAVEPKTLILVSSTGGIMINEHVLEYQKLTQENIAYIASKANSLGFSKREIHRVYTIEDGDKKHLFFDVDPIKERSVN
jgi:Holliday junction resolvase RusA-like endonuclease